jgi:GNAT superfamily N-acetyltransferase
MDLARALSLYDADVRAHPQAQPGMAIERTCGVVLITGPFNFVSAWDLPVETARASVAELAGRFRSRGETLLWRVYDHDPPADLSAHLADEGFTPNETGTLLFLDLSGDLSGVAAPTDVEVRRVGSTRDLDGFVSASGQAFGEEESWRRDLYAARLTDPDLGLYVAHVDGQPAASARLEMSADWSIGLLQGGGVAPQFRRRGLYRALVAARVDAAKARGLEYLVTDARETSRPILQRLGFVAAARGTLWALKP